MATPHVDNEMATSIPRWPFALRLARNPGNPEAGRRTRSYCKLAARVVKVVSTRAFSVVVVFVSAMMSRRALRFTDRQRPLVRHFAVEFTRAPPKLFPSLARP